MSQINSNIKDDFQVVLLLSCFVGHLVSIHKKKCTSEQFLQGHPTLRPKRKVVMRVDLIKKILRKSGGRGGLFKEGYLYLLRNWT